MALTDKLTAIANAIRGKTGKADSLTLDQMPGEIEGIQTGGGLDDQYVRLMMRGGAYNDLCTFVVPESVTKIGHHVFREWYYCERVIFHEKLTDIGISAFTYCGELKEVTFPASLKTISKNAFNPCAKLATATFKGTPTSIANNVFSGCVKLLTINVPWAEGEVADAPWGATNATINYNYTGE